MSLDRRLLAKIHVAKAQLGLSDEIYRDILRAQCGVESCADKGMTIAKAEALLAYFRSLGWRGKAAHPHARAPRPLDLPTPPQQALIGELFTAIGWADPARRVAFAKKLCRGAAWPQSRADANKLIEALKSMQQRGYSDRVSPPGEGA